MRNLFISTKQKRADLFLHITNSGTKGSKDKKLGLVARQDLDWHRLPFLSDLKAECQRGTLWRKCYDSNMWRVTDPKVSLFAFLTCSEAFFLPKGSYVNKGDYSINAYLLAILLLSFHCKPRKTVAWALKWNETGCSEEASSKLY